MKIPNIFLVLTSLTHPPESFDFATGIFSSEESVFFLVANSSETILSGN